MLSKLYTVNMNPKVNITLQVNPGLSKELDDFCYGMKMTRSDVIRRAVIFYMDKVSSGEVSDKELDIRRTGG
jgi:metal-responsive CopG/Arc/MetJ family transcriptional regulator